MSASDEERPAGKSPVPLHAGEAGKWYAMLTESPIHVAEFFAIQPLYEELCREVAFVLQRSLAKKGIAIAGITSRAKEYTSCVEKLKAKGLSSLIELRDLAGVRVVYLYNSDRPAIEAIISDKFNVRRSVDAKSNREIDRFGYEDVKFYVELKEQAGERYDSLKGYTCEIQLRTIGQDAWGIVSHHLMYKKEEHTPVECRQQLITLVGVLRVVDENFNSIRAAIDTYRQQVDAEQKSQGFHQPINVDTLIVYAEKHIGASTSAEGKASKFLGILVDLLNRGGYTSIGQVHTAVTEAKRTGVWPVKLLETNAEGTVFAAILMTLLIVDEDFRKKISPDISEPAVEYVRSLCRKMAQDAFS